MYGSLALRVLFILSTLIGVCSSQNSDAQHYRSTAVHNVVLIHGAWADGSSWRKVIPILQERGFHVVSVQIPLTSFTDDVAAVKRVIDAQDGPVLLVAHSYGGAVMSEAGNDTKVAGLVFVAAFAPDTGEAIADLGKSGTAAPGASEVRPSTDGFLFLTAKGISEDFAQDLSIGEQRLLAATQVPTAASVFSAKVNTASWHEKRTWYVIAENDRMIPPVAEHAMANRMEASIVSLRTSHAVMLAKPRQVANVIVRAALSK